MPGHWTPRRPEGDLDEREREIVALGVAIDRAYNAKDDGALIDALRAAAAHPCAPHEFDLPNLLSDLSEELDRRGDYEGALDAMQAAIDAGYAGSQPHPLEQIAEIHLRAGRRDEAARLLAEVKALTPQDIWLYNGAGMTYAEVGDHRVACQWFAEGIELGIATGDPEGVVDQLTDLRSSSLKALGLEPDELSKRAAAFVEAWTEEAAGPAWHPDYEHPKPRPCHHCGFDPEAPPDFDHAIDDFWDEDDESLFGEPERLQMSVAWFPEGEWVEATKRWPDLDEPGGHRDHSRAKEALLRRLAMDPRGSSLRIAPIRIDAYLAWCERENVDGGESQSRARYAAELDRLGRTEPWPPERNDRCWCGSGVKYKRCCATVQPSSDD